MLRVGGSGGWMNKEGWKGTEKQEKQGEKDLKTREKHKKTQAEACGREIDVHGWQMWWMTTEGREERAGKPKTK